MPRYIFLRTAWMEFYKGRTQKDLPIGAGSYVSKNSDGGEVYNFFPIRGKYYGFARIQEVLKSNLPEHEIRDDNYTLIETYKLGALVNSGLHFLTKNWC
jgi:hypothetical protein